VRFTCERNGLKPTAVRYPAMDALLVTRDDHGVVTVTMNRPEKKNAMSATMIRELTQVFDEIATSRDDRVLVLTGAGDAFTSGADLSPEPGETSAASGGVGGALHSMRLLGRLILRLHEIPKPTIAAVNGVAVGAGCNLGLGCDLVIASDAARFSEIFARRGLNLDGGGSWLLPRLIGLHKAKELAFLAEIISAEEAERFDDVIRLVLPAEPDYPTFADGVYALKLSDTIKQSAQERRWITV